LDIESGFQNVYGVFKRAHIGGVAGQHLMINREPFPGDRINAILSAAGMNITKLLKWAADLFRLFLAWFLECQRASFTFQIA